MNTITLYVVDPAQDKQRDLEQVNKFAEQMNGIYNMFQFGFRVENYKGTLNRDRDGRFLVKKMQNAVLPELPKCVLLFMIFTCPVGKIEPAEFRDLLDHLRRAKNNGVRVWFENQHGLQPVLQDISQMMARINDSIPIPANDRDRMAGIADGLFREGAQNSSKGNLPLAEAHYNRALMIQRKLVRSDRDKYLPGLPKILHELGTTLLRTRRYRDAENLYRQALAAWDELSKKENAEPTADIAGTYNNLGILFLSQGKNEEALQNYNRALEEYEKLEEKIPAEDTKRRELILRGRVDAEGNLANLAVRMKKPEDAKENFDRALDLLRGDMEKHPDDLGERNRFTGLATAEAAMLMQQGKPEEAAPLFEENEKIFDELLAKDKDRAEPLAAQNYFNEFQLNRALKKPDRAKEYWDKASEIVERRKDDNELAKRLADLMNVERDSAAKRQKQAAEDAVRKAEEALNAGNAQGAANAYRAAATLFHGLPGAENQIRSAELYSTLGNMLWDAGNTEQAEICFRNETIIVRAVAENDHAYEPDLAVALFHYGRFLDEAKDQDNNEALQEALSIAEKYADTNDKARDVYENLSDGAFDTDFNLKDADSMDDTDDGEASLPEGDDDSAES